MQPAETIKYPARKCEKCGYDIPEGIPYCPGGPCQSFTIDRIEKGPNGGILSYLDKHKYPYNGWPNEFAVGQSATFKRAVIATLKLAASAPLKWLIPLVVLLPKKQKKRLTLQVCFWVSDIYVSGFNKYQLPPTDFCASGRELLRAGLKVLEGVGDKYTRERLTYLLYSIVMTWEYDNAYRYRGQDVLSCLDRYALSEDPKKEILRLLEIGISRERGIIPDQNREDFLKSGGFDLGDKWKLALTLVKVALWAFPIVLPPMVKFLEELKLEQINFDENDMYFICKRFDYNFLGKTYEERIKIRDKMEEGWSPPPKMPNPAVIGFNPNVFFFQLSKERAMSLVQELTTKFFETWEQNKEIVDKQIELIKQQNGITDK